MTNTGSQIDKQYPFNRFAAIRRYIGFDFLNRRELPSSSSWMTYIADTNGQFNLWRQRSSLSQEYIDSEPYASHQLTNFIDIAVRHVFCSPVDDSIIFFADYQGTENFQIYKINDAFHSSWPQSITQNPKARYEWGAECFSHDGQYITYSSNEGNPFNMLVYVRNIKKNNNDNDNDNNNHILCITNKPGWYVPGCWSTDNKKLNCFQIVTQTEYDVWLLDIDRNEMVQVTSLSSKEEKSRNIAGPWLPDGQGFYIISDLRREYAGLALYDINKSKFEWILTPEHDIESVDLSKDGKILAWTENVDGYSNIYIKNTLNGEIQKILSENISKEGGVVGDLKISPVGKRIGVSMTTPTSPSNIYLIDMKTKKVDRLTESLLGNIPEGKMIQPELIKYKSFDGLGIQAFLYKPRNENGHDNSSSSSGGNSSSSKFGAILSIHGGPTSQERPSYAYAGFYQYLANNGIAVLAPNFRGSTGYGKNFESKIYHDWGGGELKDLEYAAKWLVSREWIDADRIGVFGASFGGFATLNCITRLPHYNWKAAVDIVGPSNLVTFAKAVPEHWKRLMGEWVGDPEKEEDFLKERSPITYVDNIKSTINLLIIQGANDPKVVKNESDQIIERLRNKGIGVEYMVFDDEGHGFTKYGNLIKAFKKSAEFLANRLLLSV